MEKITTHTGIGVPLRRSNVDTDQIIPAVYLKRVTRTGFEDGLFAAWRGDPGFVLNQEAYAAGSVLVAGPDFGTGSSREHAPWALTAWGIRAILSTSFADIFRNNALKNGLLPIQVETERHRQLFALVDANPTAQLTVDLEAQVVHLPGDEDLPFEVDPFARMMLLAGTDEMGYLIDQLPRIDAWEAAHPARVDTRVGAG